MKKVLLILAVVLCLGVFMLAQDTGAQGTTSSNDTSAQPAPASSTPGAMAQPSASPSDTSAQAGTTSSSDTGKADKKADKGKKASEKSAKGCLSGPDASGNYTLTHGKGTMTLAANDELKNHVGHEIKVTGTEGADKTMTVTKVEHIADSCGGKKEKSKKGSDTGTTPPPK